MSIAEGRSPLLTLPIRTAPRGVQAGPGTLSWYLGLVAVGCAGTLVAARAAPALVPGLGLLAVLGLAYANGANDVSKGVATLVGSNVARARPAIAWGVLCTAAGAFAALSVSGALAATFSGGLLGEDTGSIAPPMALVIALASLMWVLVSTRTGLPVSTTHALTGAIVGVAVAQWGASSVAWGTTGQKVLLPLAVSPVLAVTLGTLATWLAQRLPSHAPVTALHWLTSGATSFARGLNDAPKIVALGLGFALMPSPAVPAWLLFAGVALSMALGGWVSGRRVTETLAEGVIKLEHVEAVGANLATALLVGAASTLGLPVSTTHVAGAALLGGGAAARRAVRWRVVSQICLAWLVTLPAGALLAALLLGVAQG